MSEVMFTEFDDTEVRAFLKQLDTRLAKVAGAKKEYYGLLSSIVYRDVNRHFEQEMGSKGKWKKWSNSYADYMDSIGRGGNKILQWNGKMRQNFKPTNVRSQKAGVQWFNDAQTKSGFPYAGFHDQERDFMYLSPNALEDISKQTLAFLLDKGI